MFNNPPPLEGVAHIIQIALTPVFLLTGIASLLGVFSTRLGRISDRIHLLENALRGGDGNLESLMGQLAYLRKRNLALAAAVLMGTVAGAMTCCATLTLFVGTLRDDNTAVILSTSFGFAVFFTFCALMAFLLEVLLTSLGLRRSVQKIGEDHAKAMGTGVKSP
ncbi:MAG: DUF2721 domain-containing protein [Myxococcota bacterium]